MTSLPVLERPVAASGAMAVDLFAGAGGSSSGIEQTGFRVGVAANHNPIATEVHEAHFPEARHDCADISQVDFRRYPRAEFLWASPECTNHSSAKGVGRKAQDPTLWDAPDPTAERSRATMWCVQRAAEQLGFDVMAVENVWDVARWVGWNAWRQVFADMGYESQVVSLNSMCVGVPQSRDRVYVCFWRKGLKPNLEQEFDGWCPNCERTVPCRQAWKNGRTIGCYREQYIFTCTTCHREAYPNVNGADTFIDRTIPVPRIGDRTYKDGRPRPYALKTRLRIWAAMLRHGWVPCTTAGAGNTYEATPGNRARSLDQPVDTQQTTATTAYVTPPGFLVQTGHTGDPAKPLEDRSQPLDQPHPTVCASDDRLSLVVPLRGDNAAKSGSAPLDTVAANGRHHALLVTNDHQNRARTLDEPAPTLTTGNRQALLMRNNTGGGEMSTPIDEPARTITTKGHQSLLLPYYGTDSSVDPANPVGTVTTKARWSLLTLDEEAEALINECGLRMLTPEEIELAMGLMADYLPKDLTIKIRIKLCGNAVTPPAATWVADRLHTALMEAAA